MTLFTAMRSKFKHMKTGGLDLKIRKVEKGDEDSVLVTLSRKLNGLEASGLANYTGADSCNFLRHDGRSRYVYSLWWDDIGEFM